jgi:anti-sigma regulatory factor (Ser/Thr protein kinase)
LDATTTLAEFTAHGDLDEEQFDAVIGGIVTAAAQHGTPVRIFGEMVALLWAEGDVAGAMELESFWNRLAERHDYSLMCAYPQTALDAVSLGHATDVCQLHSQVHALGGQHAAALSLVRDADVHTSRVLVPTASSVRAARHFTTAALGSWAEPQIVENAALIATELAANAVKHAGSAFRVTAARLGTRIRITVEDTGPGRPQLGSPGPFDVSGRGLALTAALAEQWGWQGVTGGKEVWAELPLAYQ